ncbi:DUF397 domain-containing protein [Actinoallomurus soli]|uniref:DUF397 domain-containing protein n=1 Tax=Actinoallomurus soli TaxID=2952535 RepID=UPI0020921F15|nr:DUF397 domain-containing protein [Actinoallomurus soli]MCO5968311.1 DUF397 domain-containing protein [Actinoallomurus soli]
MNENPRMAFRKSTYSGAANNQCVEVAAFTGAAPARGAGSGAAGPARAPRTSRALVAGAADGTKGA